MLETLTIQHFTPLVGQDFQALAAEGNVPLTLLEATPVRASGAGRDEPFSLIFRGPRDAMLQQGTYTLQHDALPGLEIFIVPVSATDQGIQYQAIFN
jgi:hypothetical protein